MLKIFLFSFFILSTSIYAQDRSKWTEQDYWQSTRITFERTLYGEINTKSCHENGAEYFIGCMYAISAGVTLWKNNENNYWVVPYNDQLGYTFVYSKKDDPKIYEDYKKQLRDWYKTYEETPMPQQVAFNALYESFKVKWLNTTNEPYFTAMIYNQFLSHAYDPHTYIMTSLQYEDQLKTSEISSGRFGFTQSLVNFRGAKRMVIHSITPGSSASQSTLKASDVILSVNGKTNIEDIDNELERENSVRMKVIGSKGEKSITLVKKSIQTDSVSSEMIKSPEGRSIGYIKFSTFMDPNGCEKIALAGKNLIKEGANGIILDLRDNDGGLIKVAECLNRKFLEKNSHTFIYEDITSGSFTEFKTTDETGVFRDIHSVVLINAYSASASEIVSIYLQAYRKAFIVGQNSFGKGTMQGGEENPEGYLKYQTIAKYYGPHLVSPQLQGVVPDIEATLKFEQPDAEAKRERDRYDNAIENNFVEVPVMEERLQEIEQIKDCIKDDQVELRSFEEKDEFAQLIHDNQKTVGLGTLDCAIKINIPIFKKIKIPVKD